MKNYTVAFEIRKRGSVGQFMLCISEYPADSELEAIQLNQAVLHDKGYETRGVFAGLTSEWWDKYGCPTAAFPMFVPD